MKNHALWTMHNLEDKDLYCVNLHVLKIWIRRKENELWLAFKHDSTETPEIDASKLEDLEYVESLNPDWQRWTLKKNISNLNIAPAFPNLPVLVKPEYPFRVIKNIRTRIYIRVPLWVQIMHGETVLLEIPSVVLSKTWFGNFVGGELCYWISSSAKKEIEPDLTRPFLAICPVDIFNKSNDELHVEKICLRVDQLSVFNNSGQLWASETRAKYRGKNEGSVIEVSRKPPSEVPAAELISNSRSSSKKGFTALTFASFKNMSHLHFLQK